MPPESIAPTGGGPVAVTPPVPRRSAAFLAAVAVLLAAFHGPLIELARFSLADQLSSYIPLIPLVSLYLGWLTREAWQIDSQPPRRLAAIPFSIGLGLLAVYWWGRHIGWRFDASDYLALMTASLVALIVAAGFAFVGAHTLRTIAFPLAFLIFAVPMPTMLHQWVETFLQRASADAAEGFFFLTFMPNWREGQVFHLPGMSLEVAPECSGIHSTLVLFITSVLASHLFLRATSRRVVLVCFVLPLALLRNGFRILVIGELCVHIGPEMINSSIHHHGGPLFFVLSLIPFFYLLRWLRRSESLARPSP